MYKAKLCSFAVACMIGSIGLSPMTVLASETNTESITLSERDKDQEKKRAAFEEAIKKANEKWNTLTKEQKSEIYGLIENEMKAEMKLIDKFVEFGVMQKTDADSFKIHMMEKLNRLKESGEFPLFRQNGRKKQ